MIQNPRKPSFWRRVPSWRNRQMPQCKIIPLRHSAIQNLTALKSMQILFPIRERSIQFPDFRRWALIYQISCVKMQILFFLLLLRGSLRNYHCLKAHHTKYWRISWRCKSAMASCHHCLGLPQSSKMECFLKVFLLISVPVINWRWSKRLRNWKLWSSTLIGFRGRQNKKTLKMYLIKSLIT